MALRRVAVVLATLLLACGARGKPVVDFFSGREDATIGGAPVMGGSDPIEYGDSPNIFERMARVKAKREDQEEAKAEAVDSSSHESTLRRSLAAASSKSKAPAKNKRQPPPANAKRPPPPLAAAPQAQRTLSFFGNFTAASPGGLNTPTCDHWQGFLQLLPETATYRSFQATSSAGVTTNCTGSAASQICRALASISTDPKSPQSALRGPFLCGGVLVGVDGRCGTDPSGRPLGVGLTYNTQNRIFPDSAVACRGSCTFFQAGGSIHPCMAGDAGWGGWGSPTCKGFAPPAVVQVACEVAGPA